MSESSSSSKKSVRNCPMCKVRMSGSDVDPHLVCVSCRGSECNLESRCEICEPWTDARMTAYLKHLASLERKRRSKKKAKEQVVDFATLCTGVQDADAVLSEEGLACGGGGDSVSSVALSAQAQNVESIVTSKWVMLSQDMRQDFTNQLDERDAKIQNKLDNFGQNMLDLVNTIKAEFSGNKKRSRDDSDDDDDCDSNHSFSAPRQVPGRRPKRRPSPPLSDTQLDSDSQVSMRAGPVPDESIESPQLSPDSLRTLDQLDAMFDSGLLEADAYTQLRARVFERAGSKSKTTGRQSTPLQGDQGYPQPDGQAPDGGGNGPRPSRPSSGMGSPVQSEADTESGAIGTAEFKEIFELISSLIPECKGVFSRPPAFSYLTP